MSFEYQNFATLGVNLNRQKYGPLDISNVFNNQKDLNYYLSKGSLTEGVSSYWLNIVPYPYAGQIVALVNSDKTVQIFVLVENEDGTFKTSDIGAKVDLSNYSTTEEMNQAITNAVNGIDLTNFITNTQLEEAIKNIVIPENTDTKTTIVSGDNYIDIDGTLENNANNTFTITINEESLKALIGSETTAAMEFKGATHELPLLADKGDIYKVSAVFMVPAEQDSENKGFATSIGDSIVCDGEGKWYLIPSGDDVEDTWRPITGVDNQVTLTFSAGNLLEVSVGADGKIAYSHSTVAKPIKTNVDNNNREYITSITTDGYGHITGYNVSSETVVDTNDIYNAGNGIEIIDGEENNHTVSIKIAANEANLSLDENGLSTNFNLTDYTTNASFNSEVQRAQKAEQDLSDRIDNKVEKVYYTITNEDGSTSKVEGTLLTPEEKEKLSALSIDEDGSVGISGTVSASNVQELYNAVVNIVTGTGTGSYDGSQKELLNIESGAEKNYINSVNEDNFTVTNGLLELKAVTPIQVTGLEQMMSTVDTLDKTINNETSGLTAVFTKVSNLENNLNNYVTVDNFNKTVGDLNELLNSNKTIKSRLDEINTRLTWQDLE